jgi:hypothetical protein
LGLKAHTRLARGESPIEREHSPDQSNNIFGRPNIRLSRMFKSSDREGLRFSRWSLQPTVMMSSSSYKRETPPAIRRYPAFSYNSPILSKLSDYSPSNTNLGIGVPVAGTPPAFLTLSYFAVKSTQDSIITVNIIVNNPANNQSKSYTSSLENCVLTVWRRLWERFFKSFLTKKKKKKKKNSLRMKSQQQRVPHSGAPVSSSVPNARLAPLEEVVDRVNSAVEVTTREFQCLTSWLLHRGEHRPKENHGCSHFKNVRNQQNVATGGHQT